MHSILTRLVMCFMLALFAFATPQTATAQSGEPLPEIDRSATGGATTLEDILRRQEGLKGDNSYRSGLTGNSDIAAPITDNLGTLGGASDPELWRAMRFNAGDITTQDRNPAATVLMQDGGMAWLLFREGPLLTYGGYLLLGTLGLLVLFYLVRGKIRIDGEKTGHRIQRFAAFERFSHWLLAGSFILLGITGLISLMGRKFLIPAFGHEAFATIALASKWVHNNVSWAFIVALVFVFFLWVVHNIPNRTDLAWLAKGGGIFVKGVHPPAKKFNAGQKVIFWSVILMGGSIAASGLSLLFPFELPMFAATFEKMQAVGITSLPFLGELSTQLTPHEEMQYAQAWHSIVAFVLMAIVIAHIYIGSVGMEGAYDAMGSGMVEEQWAREHHSLWVAELDEQQATSGKSAPGGATPAE